MPSRNNTHLPQPIQQGSNSVAKTHPRRSPVNLLVRAVILIGWLVIWLAEQKLENSTLDRWSLNEKHNQIQQLKDKLDKLERYEIWEKS